MRARAHRPLMEYILDVNFGLDARDFFLFPSRLLRVDDYAAKARVKLLRLFCFSLRADGLVQKFTYALNICGEEDKFQ